MICHYRVILQVIGTGTVGYTDKAWAKSGASILINLSSLIIS